MFFFSIKSDRSYLASTQWAMAHQAVSGIILQVSTYVCKPNEEITHRRTSQNLYHVTYNHNPFVNPTCNAFLGIFCTGRYIYAHIHPQKSLIRSTFKTSNMQEYQEITVFYKFQLSNTNQ